MNTLIENATFVCLDTETTGLTPDTGGKICEVALLASRAQKRIASYGTLINPQVFIMPDVIAIHGITNEMVQDKPVFKDIAPKIRELLEGNVLICHNADFDTKFLRHEFEQIGQSMPNCTILDTLKYARLHGHFKRNRLGLIAQELGVSSQGWHRAMADTIMTEKIFYYFLFKFKDMGARTLQDLFNLQNRRCL
jgi:exonuclease, DNA polymerase III, epsilon subunit family